jgi:hypothetical protein
LRAKTKGNGSIRILIIVQNLPVPFDRRVWLECRTLTRAGYQVAVVCPKGPGDPSYQVIDGVQIYKYRPYSPGGGARLLVDLIDDEPRRRSMGAAARRRIEEKLAQSHQEPHYLSVYDHLLGHEPDTQHVATSHAA